LAANGYTWISSLDRINVSGIENIRGTEQGDLLTGDGNANVIEGGAGTDTLRGGGGNDTIFGGLGNDTMNGGAGDDLYIISLGSEHTVAEISDSGVADINGLGNLDEVRFTSTTAGDTLTLFAGDIGIETIVIGTNVPGVGTVADYTATTALNVNASALSNNLYRSSFTFSLNLYGNNGNNQLTGSAFNDFINGINGDDTILGGNGDDYLLGGSGNDTLIFNDDSSVNASLLFSRASGDGTDYVSEFENVIGTSFNDFLEGNDVANIIKGGGGNDFIQGMDGNDTLEGGSGNDTLFGYRDHDLMTGGFGNDIFGFNDLLIFPEQNSDTLTDFTSGSDKIFLFDYIFTPLAYGIYSDMFISSNGTVVAQDTNDFLLYNKNTGDFFYDADGSGSASAFLIANLLPNTTLLASDFVHYSPIAEPTITGLKILGTLGGESLSGTANDDTINGLQGIDTISAGSGNDTIRGGQDSDTLTGGLGADMFTWQLTDKSYGLSVANHATDTITDFSLIQNDKLDLRDLLVDESSANILNYLDVAVVGGNTEIHISSSGTFASGNYSVGNEDARIVLAGVDLFTATGTTTEAALINNLISQNKLIIDV
jgi:Ca2+-binding RTX toxin-like protein